MLPDLNEAETYYIDRFSPTGVSFRRYKSPVKGLPIIIGEAVAEVQRNIQAPMDLVIASALGALSLACQDEIDVRSGSGFVSPCSLFLLTIAESGERKSTVDRLFTSPIIKFEEDGDSEYQKEMGSHNSDMEAWTILHKEILRGIKNSNRTGALVEEIKSELHIHNKNKPLHPKRKKLIYSDATPQSIAYGLNQHWPSAGIMSDEAGGILNGHAMNDLGMLNQLWDGSTLNVDRRTSDSFTLKDARLTISLMTQENSLRKFIDRRDSLARDIGFLARCLVSNPVSTQGNRPIENDSTHRFEKLDAFKERIRLIINENFEEKLKPNHKRKVLELSKAAKTKWLLFYNHIENNLREGGFYSNIKDAASKIADNATRLAAIFDYFEGNKGDISESSMNDSIFICTKYIDNFKKLFGAYGIFTIEYEEVNSLIEYLKAWIHDHPREHEIRKNDIRQSGPLRNTASLNKALNSLKSSNAISTFQKIDIGNQLKVGTGKKTTEFIHLYVSNNIFSNGKIFN